MTAAIFSTKHTVSTLPDGVILMERYIIDRFEEEYAVLERQDGTTTDVLKELIGECAEGDVVVEEKGIYRVDKAETEERRRLIAEKMNKLFGNK